MRRTRPSGGRSDELALLSRMIVFCRNKYEGKYPAQIPTACFKGNYGTMSIGTLEMEKEASARAFAEKEQLVNEEGKQLKDL